MNRVRAAVFTAALAWRQLRDDPRRALRLAIRIVLRLAPGRLRARLRSYGGPSPRRADREIADLERLLAVADGHRDAAGGRGDLAAGGRGERARDRSDGGLGLSVGEISVLHFATNSLPHTQAGYTVRTHKIALAQRAAGLDPHVLTRLGYPLTHGVPDARSEVTVDGISYHRLIPWAPPRNPVRAVRVSADLAAPLVAALRPQVLHAASNHANAAVALELRERYGLPVVYEVRGFLEDSWLSRDTAHRTDSPFYRLTRELESSRMRAADVVVTLGEAMKEEILGRGVRRVIVVPNGVDETFLEPLPDGSGLRAGLGFGAREVVIGLTSTFYGFEGIDTLISAFAALRGAPVRLLLVGDGPQRAALERQAARLDVDAVFTGRVPLAQVRRYHAVLDVFAVPRRADRVCELVTPLKPLEAMAGGIPVIASDVKALREIVEPGVTGTLTLPEDPEAWANSLEKLIYSPELRRETGQAARHWVAERRTWRAVTHVISTPTATSLAPREGSHRWIWWSSGSGTSGCRSPVRHAAQAFTSAAWTGTRGWSPGSRRVCPTSTMSLPPRSRR